MFARDPPEVGAIGVRLPLLSASAGLADISGAFADKGRGIFRGAIIEKIERQGANKLRNLREKHSLYGVLIKL